MASTYVNNLGLEEMATGDQSGSWGTTTNKNLTLIGEALGWGTRAIANASTDNMTVGDGNEGDPDRSLAIKLTGGGQACTVTLQGSGTNQLVVSKVWIMHNTTNSTLTFSSGSGANVAILAGETKIIATDGLGSGGVVYDLLTGVNLAGTTKTAALVNAGALTAGGDITRGGTVIGDGSITDTGDYTIDVVGDIILDADGADILFKDGGVHFASINYNGNDAVFKSIIQDKDIIFSGNDGGSGITALSLDMSDAGAATFNSDIILADGKVARFGNSQDFRISFDTHGILQNVTSDSDILIRGSDGGNVITALTLDMSAAGAATFSNDVTAFSDERLKSNITTIPDALSKVTEMRGVHYVRDATGKDSTGVIAQELQKIAPELVLTAEDEMGTLSVNYGNITGYLIEAVKELSARVKELEGK